MSDLYSGKYAPPPVKVVGYWNRRRIHEVKRGMFTTFQDLGLTAQAATQAVVNSYRLAVDMEKQEQQIRRAFK